MIKANKVITFDEFPINNNLYYFEADISVYVNNEDYDEEFMVVRSNADVNICFEITTGVGIWINHETEDLMFNNKEIKLFEDAIEVDIKKFVKENINDFDFQYEEDY